MLYGAEDQNIVLAAPPSGYIASAVHFAGGVQGFGPTWLNIPSLSASNGTDYSFSFWSKGLCTLDNIGAAFFVHDAAGIYSPASVTANTGGGVGKNMEWYFYPVAGGNWDARLKESLFTSTAWHHLLFSASFSTSHFALYVDDAFVSYSSTTGTGNFFNAAGAETYPISSVYNAKSFTFGDDLSGIGPDFDVADVWFAPGVSLLDGTGLAISSTNRRQFIDGLGKPVDPMTWPTSAVQFYGNASNFATNHGTGGMVTLNGTLTNASTHP